MNKNIKNEIAAKVISEMEDSFAYDNKAHLAGSSYFVKCVKDSINKIAFLDYEGEDFYKVDEDDILKIIFAS